MKHTRQAREVSVSVLEARLERAVRPKDRLWATIRLAEKLTGMEIAPTKRALTLFAEAERMAIAISDSRGVAAALRGTGSGLLHLSNFTAALESLERAMPIAERTGDAECEILVLRDMGHIYWVQSRYDLALKTLQQCIELAELIGNTLVQASAIDLMGATFMHLSRYDEALECHTKSLTLLDRPGYRHHRAMSLTMMCHSLRLLGRYADALSVIMEARQLLRAAPDNWAEGICQNRLGAIHIEIGNYPTALSSYLTAAKILRRTGDKLNLAIAHENLMELYLKLGNTEQARPYGERALAIYEEIGDKRDQASALMLFGDYCLYRGERSRAMQFLQQCIALSREIGSKEYEAKATTKLANLETDRGKFALAEKLLHDALSIAGENNRGEYTIAALLGLGRLFNKQAQPDRALLFLDRAITIAQETYSRSHEQEVHQMLAETFEAKGDLEEALRHWKLASKLKEEILGTEKQNALAALQIRSNIEKAEKGRALLRKEAKLKSREIEHITMELAEKTERTRNISRRIKRIIKQPNGTGDTYSQIDQLLSELEWDHSTGDKETISHKEFQLVHRNILQKLSKRYPALTSMERKVCVLLREGFSTKQMADLLKVSARTIETHRYVIRKKIQLDAGTNLTTLLAGM